MNALQNRERQRQALTKFESFSGIGPVAVAPGSVSFDF